MGGGVLILYTSDILKCSPNFIIFEVSINLYSNIATNSGGALILYDTYSECSRKFANYSIFNCFFTAHGLINLVNLNFSDNKASDSSSNIYGGAIQYCQVEVKDQKLRGYQLLQNLTKTSTDIKSGYDTYKIVFVMAPPIILEYKEVKCLTFL